jgi:hypothetical protein
MEVILGLMVLEQLVLRQLNLFVQKEEQEGLLQQLRESEVLQLLVCLPRMHLVEALEERDIPLEILVEEVEERLVQMALEEKEEMHMAHHQVVVEEVEEDQTEDLRDRLVLRVVVREAMDMDIQEVEVLDQLQMEARELQTQALEEVVEIINLLLGIPEELVRMVQRFGLKHRIAQLLVLEEVEVVPEIMDMEALEDLMEEVEVEGQT